MLRPQTTRPRRTAARSPSSSSTTISRSTSKRTKSLLRDDHRRRRATPLGRRKLALTCCKDEELVDLISPSPAGSGSSSAWSPSTTDNLKDVNKSFNKPETYQGVLESLANRNIYAITSFIFGMDNDTPGVAARTLEKIEELAARDSRFSASLRPFRQPLSTTACLAAGRLDRPKHWMDFAPFVMCHKPLKMTIEEARARGRTTRGANSYSPQRNKRRHRLPGGQTRRGTA